MVSVLFGERVFPSLKHPEQKAMPAFTSYSSWKEHTNTYVIMIPRKTIAALFSKIITFKLSIVQILKSFQTMLMQSFFL